MTYPGEERKALVPCLAKLFLPDTLDEDRARRLAILVHALRTHTQEPTIRTACTRFETSLAKRYASAYAGWSVDETAAFPDLAAFLATVPDHGTKPAPVRARSKGIRITKRATAEPETSESETASDSEDEIGL